MLSSIEMIIEKNFRKMLNTSNKDDRLLLHMTGMQLRFKIKTEKLFAIFPYMFLSKCSSSLNKVEE